MTTLPNPFLSSAASLQPVASSPLSSLSEAAVTPIQSSCGGSRPTAVTPCLRDTTEQQPSSSVASGQSVDPTDPQETEAAVRRAAASDLDQLANYFRRHDSRFIPDREAIWDAMFDETAPRLRADDPVWADDAPLFLKAIG